MSTIDDKLKQLQIIKTEIWGAMKHLKPSVDDKYDSAKFTQYPTVIQENFIPYYSFTTEHVNGAINIVPNIEKYCADLPVKLEAIPDSGYKFDRWDDDSSLPAIREIIIGEDMLDKYIAHFRLIYYYPVTLKYTDDNEEQHEIVINVEEGHTPRLFGDTDAFFATQEEADNTLKRSTKFYYVPEFVSVIEPTVYEITYSSAEGNFKVKLDENDNVIFYNDNPYIEYPIEQVGIYNNLTLAIDYNLYQITISYTDASGVEHPIEYGTVHWVEPYIDYEYDEDIGEYIPSMEIRATHGEGSDGQSLYIVNFKKIENN